MDRKTVQRSLIFQAVEKLNIHATAEQVYEYVVQKHPSISKSTVYRNLSQMAESGKLLNIGNFYGTTHYDHQLHEHFHFICEKCRQIFDVEGEISEILSKMADTEGLVIKSCNLSLSGLCRECK